MPSCHVIPKQKMFKSCDLAFIATPPHMCLDFQQGESAKAIAYSMGHHSGGHLNPAVTLSLLGIFEKHYPTSVVRLCKIGLIFISVAKIGYVTLNCSRSDFVEENWLNKWCNNVDGYLDRCGSWYFLYFDVFDCLCVCVWSQYCVELLHIYVWIYSKALQWCRIQTSRLGCGNAWKNSSLSQHDGVVKFPSMRRQSGDVAVPCPCRA